MKPRWRRVVDALCVPVWLGVSVAIGHAWYVGEPLDGVLTFCACVGTVYCSVTSLVDAVEW